jgi:hypothetical protein
MQTTRLDIFIQQELAKRERDAVVRDGAIEYLQRFDWSKLTTLQLLDALKIISGGEAE